MGIKKFLHEYFIVKKPELALKPRKVIRDTKVDLFDILATDEEKNPEMINAYGLPIKEVEKVLEDMVLEGKITDGSFLYAWDKYDKEGKENGAVKFSAVAKTPLYKQQINDNEEILYKDDGLDTIIDHMSRNKKTHIELGPESGEKFIKYSDERDPEHIHVKGKRYIGVDVSGVYVDMANKNVAAKTGMICEGVPGDRFKHSVFDKEQDQIYYFFGGSIGNLDVGSVTDIKPEENQKTIIHLLKRMRSNQPFVSVPAVISYFEAPEKNDPNYHDIVERLRAAYGAKDSTYYDEKTHIAQSDFILSGFEALGFERSKLELVVEYDDTTVPAAIKVGAKFIERTEIKIGKNKIIKEKDDIIRAIKSQRFTKEMFEKIANDGGFEVKYQKSRNGVAVSVLQSKLGMNDKFKKARNMGYGLLIGTMLLSGGLFTKHIIHQQEIKKEIQKEQEKSLKDKQLYSYADMGSVSFETLEQKEKFINGLMEDIVSSIEIRYGEGSLSKKDLNSLIKDELLTGDNINQFFNANNEQEKIIEFADVFVKEHKNYLLEHGVDVIPYGHLKEYEQKFKNTINVDMTYEEAKKSFDVKYSTYMGDIIDASGTTDHVGGYQLLSGGEFDIGTYTSRYAGSSMDLSNPQGKSEYMYATFYLVGNNDSDQEYPHEYTLGQSKIVAYDYFEQTRPVVGKILSYYYKIFNNKSYDKYSYNKYGWNTPQKDRREVIITDLVNTGKIDEIDENDNAAIVDYVFGCLKRHDVYGEKRLLFVPYDTLSGYEDVLKNSIQEFKNPGGIGYIHDDQKDDYAFVYLGTYLTQKGVLYDYGVATIEGETCVVGRNKNTKTVMYRGGEETIDTDYYIYVGKEIAEDYFALKKKLRK